MNAIRWILAAFHWFMTDILWIIVTTKLLSWLWKATSGEECIILLLLIQAAWLEKQFKKEKK